MSHPTKIATCSYCGNRAALVFDGGRHELACASCGAPLHEMKQIPAERSRRAHPSGAGRRSDRHETPRRKTKGKKKKKSLGRKAAKGLFDLLDDIFD